MKTKSVRPHRALRSHLKNEMATNEPGEAIEQTPGLPLEKPTASPSQGGRFFDQGVYEMASSAALCMLLGLSAACSVEDPCDPDQTLRNGGCYPSEEDDTTADEDATEQAPSDTNGSDIDGGPLPAGSEETAEPMEEANLGAMCATQEDCLGGTVCAADEGLPECLGLCAEGDPFEDRCPATNPCIELQGNFLCNPF